MKAGFDALIAELRAEAGQAVWHIGFMRVAIDDNALIADRLNGSHSGYAGVIARDAVRAALVLFCARAWDKAPDAVSLRTARKSLPSLDDLQKHHREWSEARGIGFSEERLARRYEEFAVEFDAAEALTGHRDIRQLRTEFLAHRIPESRDRQKFRACGAEVEPVTYDGLLEIAETTVTLVGNRGYIWDRLSNPYPDQIAYAEDCCRRFWHNLPVLRDVEDPAE